LNSEPSTPHTDNISKELGITFHVFLYEPLKSLADVRGEYRVFFVRV